MRGNDTYVPRAANIEEQSAIRRVDVVLDRIQPTTPVLLADTAELLDMIRPQFAPGMSYEITHTMDSVTVRIYLRGLLEPVYTRKLTAS